MSCRTKYNDLVSYISQFPSAVVAFSGGVDSTLLCRAAHDALKDNSLAITAVSPFIPEREQRQARRSAASIGIPHRLIDLPEMPPEVMENPPDRCYHCKKFIFHTILAEAESSGFRFVLDGSNLDDLKDYRPGTAALKELKIISPLLETGFTKEVVREISRQLELETWDLPAYACLASRVPYGNRLSAEILKIVEEGEDLLHSLGFKTVRVRHHGDIARIEASPEEMELIFKPPLRDEITEELKKIGFSYICLDMEGYRTGSLNLNLQEYKDV